MFVEPPTPKGVATRRRILDAAVAEFAERGIAGARIERIAAVAHANKAQLYSYFGSKDRLFDEVVSEIVEGAADDLPFDAEDLAGWAVRIYDQNLRRPELARLIAWIRLERKPSGAWFEPTQHDSKLVAVHEAQRLGQVRRCDPLELLTLIIAMASAWSPASGVFAASAQDAEEEHERRRALLRQSVRLVVQPELPPAPGREAVVASDVERARVRSM